MARLNINWQNASGVAPTAAATGESAEAAEAQPARATISDKPMMVYVMSNDPTDSATRKLDSVAFAKEQVGVGSKFFNAIKMTTGDAAQVTASLRGDKNHPGRALAGREAEEKLCPIHPGSPENVQLIKTDSIKLRQILLNLLSNAGKFTHAGEINFSVAMDDEPESGWIVFAVRDTGIGMSQDQVEKVFAAFTQADNSTTRKYGGTGLGLTITKRFCEIMGGTIEIDSKPGLGSLFVVRLPLAFGY